MIYLIHVKPNPASNEVPVEVVEFVVQERLGYCRERVVLGVVAVTLQRLNDLHVVEREDA